MYTTLELILKKKSKVAIRKNKFFKLPITQKKEMTERKYSINMDKYKIKKEKNQDFYNLIEPFVSRKNLKLIEDCGGFLMFLADKFLENKKLHSGDFCKNRFCPMCAWRLAMRDTLKISILMQYIKEEHDKDFIFLTLTTPNVRGEHLEEEIVKYNKAFKNLMQRTEVKTVVKGYIRKLEVTYSKEKYITKEMYLSREQYYINRELEVDDENPTYNTYNPHFHVVIAVDKSYFKSRLYIKHSRWLELWRECTKDETITQVHIQKAKGDNAKQVYELAKYSAKDSDYLINEEVFGVFYKALKGKQLVVYSGLFKDGLQLFKRGELDKYKQKDLTEYIYMLAYKWQTNDYEEYIKRELTEEEKKKFNYNYKEDTEVD